MVTPSPQIESAKKLLASGVPPKDVAKNLGVSIPTLYRWVPASTHIFIVRIIVGRPFFFLVLC
ncbi:helix-turn-helix domain-containing protein [Klebsiella quasipneumoniae]|uniref:helix-turn-helix domain-containing protein n=1 Tax=Klebsiella quasipneumoniae TaxID=1463165 RepID=UPI003743F9B2